MNKNLHDILVGVLVLVAVLMAVTTNYWLPQVKHLNYLFNDNITIGLIAVVVILLTLYDCKLGIAFAFVVAVVAVNMQNEGFESFQGSNISITFPGGMPPRNTDSLIQEPITTITDGKILATFPGGIPPRNTDSLIQEPIATSTDVKIPITFPGGMPPRNTTQAGSMMLGRQFGRRTLPYSAQIKSQSAIAIPKKSIKKTRTKPTTEGFQNMAAPTNAVADKVEKQMQVPAPATCNATDFNTYSAGKNYHGFDVAGCRYDLENKTQNSTPYGPPLSWCATYKDSKLPVPFYPLNG